MTKLHKYGDGSTYPVKTFTGTSTAGDLIYHTGYSSLFPRPPVWDNELIEATLNEIKGIAKEFTCEFCSRANPIANLECERCGAPRKAV